MKNGEERKYLYWALTVLAVVVCSIAFFFMLFKLDAFMKFLGQLIDIFKPFIYGLVMAYLLVPVFNWCYRMLVPIIKKHAKSDLHAVRIAKALSTACSMVFLILIVVALLWMVLPQLVTSIMGVADSLPGSIRKVSEWLQNILANNPEIEKTAMEFYQEGIDTLTQWVKTDMLPQLNSLMNGLWGTVTFLKNVLIGLFVCIYVLNSKELFAAQSKKLTYSLFKVPRANLLIDNVRFVHHIFGGFINGKLLDSLIIGIICFIGMSVFHLPYAMLISVVIGVTNIIPFFGPFIGAVPSTLLILLANPIQALYFLVFVLALQQFDGNILGPKILGDSTGLSSFWVMFAILVFGGLFGFTGMVVGVPFFAVIYSLIAGLVNRSLRGKALPDDTKDYYGLDHIEKDRSLCYEKRKVRSSVKTSTKEE